MNNLNSIQLSNVYPEFINNGFFITTLFWITCSSLVLGILVLITKNPIVSILLLIGLFLCVSVYLLLNGLNFIGIAYLLVYIGAISILFIFILMLINVRISEVMNSPSNGLFLTFWVGITFFLAIYSIFNQKVNSLTKSIQGYPLDISIRNWIETYIISDHKWFANIFSITEIASIGSILYSVFASWLMIISIILLLAMVGTIVITVSQIKFWVNLFNLISQLNISPPRPSKYLAHKLESGLEIYLNYKNLSFLFFCFFFMFEVIVNQIFL